jgi:GAF domain-containing protein
MKTADSSLRRSSSKIRKIFIPTFLTVAVIFNILAPFFAWEWLAAPFPQVLFYPGLIVSDFYNPNWEVRELGLQPGDRLLAINEQPVSSGRELFFVLRELEADEPVSLEIEPTSTAAAQTFTVLLQTLSSGDFFIFFWLPYLIGLAYLGLGLVVARLRNDRSGHIFVIFCVFASLLAAGIFDQNTLHLLTPIWSLVFPLAGAALIHFAFIFPTETRLTRYRPWIRLAPYGLALALGLVNLYSIYLGPDPRFYLTARLWSFSFVSLAVILFLAMQLYIRFATLSPLVQQQSYIVFLGGVAAFGPSLLWGVAGLWGLQPPFVWSIYTGFFAPVIAFPVVIAYALLRFRVLDLDVIFNRGVVYTLLTAMITAVYFLIVNFLGSLLNDVLFDHPLVLAVFVVTLVIFLDPVKQQLQSLVNRMFLRESIDYQQLLQNYGRMLIATPLKTDHILEMLVKQADDALRPDHALVFLRDATLGAFKVNYQRGGSNLQPVAVRFGLSDDLAQWLADTNNILQISPTGAVSTDIKISQEELARLNMLNIVLCVPLLGAENLLGWLALGLKKSGQPYTGDDLLFLATLANQTTIALENAQFLEAANQRAAELEALQKISVDIQSEVESDKLLTSVVAQATKLLQAEGGLVYLLEPDSKSLKVVVSYDLDQDYTGCMLRDAEDIAGRVLALGEAVAVDNYHNFPRRSTDFKDAKFGAVLGVPLRWGGKVRGVLQLVHRPQGLRFRENDIWLMELFASQSVIALEQSRLLHEARRTARQLTTLSEVSTAISSTLDLDVALQRVMDRAVQILSAEAGSLLLMDPQGRYLTFEVVLGPTGKELLGLKIAVGKGIVGTVAETGRPLIVNDVMADPRWNVDFDKATHFETKDLLCVPMLAHGQVIGVIEVINKQDGTVFTEDECNLLLSFGAQAAIAIENAQRFTRTDQALAERVQELQTLQLFEQNLQISLELERVLDITLTNAMDALGISMGLMGIMAQDNEPGLYLLAQRGMPMEMARYKKDPWPLNRGVMGRVIRTGEAALVNDITQERDYVPTTHRTRSLLAVPIIRDDRVIGVMNLESTDPDFFTEEDLSFVTILVSHAAIAIDNAQLFDQVKQVNQAKSEFMNMASHELKIPMTSIKGYAKLLQMGAAGALTDQQKEFLNIIARNVDRMDQLVNNLLDVSRIEAKRIRLQIENVQISQVIHDVIESVQNQVKNKDLNLILSIDENLPEIRADYNRMVQIVTNLVSNAYKYTPAGGSITVTAKPYYQNGTNGDAQGIAVTVKDTGYGISKEDQAKLFTNFFRSGDQNIRDEPGTGLGLSITKTMVETHGGELTFESEHGKGSSFTFTAPLISKIPPGVEVIER